MKYRTHLLLGFLPLFAFMILLVVISQQSIQTQQAFQTATRLHYRVISAAERVESQVHALQLAEQTVRRAGVASPQRHFEDKKVAYVQAINHLKSLLADSPRQSERLAAVEALVDRWLAQAADADMIGGALPTDIAFQEDLHDRINRLTEAERDALDQRQLAAEASAHQYTFWTGLSAGLTMLLGIGIWLNLMRKTSILFGSDPVELAAMAERLTTGDLDFDLSGKSGLAATIGELATTLRDAGMQARTIALGDYSADISARSSRDELGLALQNMTRTLREIAQVAEKVADGDLDIMVETKGEKDLLAQSMNRMIGMLKEATRQANRVAAGDYSIDIAPRSEKDALGEALHKMSIALRTAHAEMTQRDWLKDSLALLGDALRGDPSLDTLSATAIKEISSALDAAVGALFLASTETAPVLTLAGSYAYRQRKGLSNQFSLGEGLVGQAALERQQIVISDVPEDYVRVTSGLGERVPRFICATPFLYENRLKGVVEIGTLGELTRTQMEFLNQAMAVLATAVESAQARETQAKLLEESRQLSEELQTQQEELRSTNEELEEQTQRLTMSEDLLQRQQEELKVSNEELEEKNALLERQKREVERARQDIAVKADEVALASKYKSEFLANMSHELRTPLNSLLLLAQSLASNREGNLSPDQLESAKIILSSGSDLLGLINEILDLSKIEAGRMDLQIHPVSLDDLAESLRATFGRMTTEKGLNLTIEIDTGAPAEISSDRKRLDQILRNLMSNAIKFTASGSIRVRMTRPTTTANLAHVVLAEDNCLAIAIQDTGIGIPQAKHKLIFEAFQQADGSTSREYGGTGLGLTISRELSALLGGEIQLDSEPGRGSTFTLFLPIKPEASVARNSARPAPQTPPQQPVPTGSTSPPTPNLADDRDRWSDGDQTILVIEDDAKFAAILRGMCHTHGFKCLIAGSGEDGLAMAKKYRPSGVVLDLQLPGMDGLTVLSQLKEDIHTRHIPVHIVSVIESCTESLRRGAVGYAVKPLDQVRLDEVFLTLSKVAANQPKRLLIVEDDPLARRDTVKLIESADLQIDEVETGAQAMQALRESRYDCMILDLKLPDIGGRQLLEALKRDSVALPPIIVHTARNLTSEEEMELRQHADSIVIKDVRSPERLLDEVTLFLHRVVSQLPENQRNIIRDLYDSDAPLRGKKVLVVDDDMRTLFAITRLLAERGLLPIKAENGERALHLLAQQPDVDLVLMDIMMPVMDGYETMQRIRAQAPFRHVPIIALTAKAMPEDRQKCLEAGASDYLPKPIDTERLFSLMRVWLYA